MNNKFLSTLVICGLAALTLTSCKNTKENCSEELIVGTSADYPPFSYFSNGKIIGFEVALAKLISKELGVCVTFKDMPFDSIIGALQAKRIDFSISAISETEQRKKSVDFSESYHTAGTVVLTENSSEIKMSEDTYNCKVGVQMGTSYEIPLKEKLKTHPKMSIQSLNKIPDLLQDLWAKRICGIVMGDTEAASLVNRYKNLRSLSLGTAKVSYAIAFPKGSKLRDKINGVIQKIKDSGELEILRKKYLFSN